MAEKPIVVVPDSKDSNLARLVEGTDRPFPSADGIELWEPFADPFKVPAWCDQTAFEYAWLHINDSFRPLEVALEQGHWNIVKRINHVMAPTEAFRAHGAVERGEQVLVYRPRDLGEKLRQLPAKRHAEIAGERREGKVGDHYDLTYAEGKEAEKDKAPSQIYAFEEAGAAKDSEAAKESLQTTDK